MKNYSISVKLRVIKPEWSDFRFIGYVQDAEEERDKIFQQVKEIRRMREGSFNPAKLHLVQRVKSLYGRPYWEKLTMKNLKLDGKPSSYVILKNTPSINRTLWTVKHLIKVKPITFPYGLPKEGDYSGTFLKPSGEMFVSQKLKVNPECLLENPKREQVKMDTETLKKELRRKWVT
ncbi:39S ribosomal protein L30, mitochondrial-like isoform X2 [Limulus polyphemus]|uniref:Large ribosomal subunit protein uL30m n=1 Tax=Limulus polyphemus TaxID=6850 RepID=A0ABM1T4U0_LIMPO|nr:39S ribosomal protein L30, mitochondrial-like isoform X2 [Limulus polyphemus]